MMLQFAVENYMSFKNRVVLNLTASKTDNSHGNNYTDLHKDRCLKSVTIYGANASGKSCLLKAMTTAVMIVRESQLKQVNEKLFRIVPFSFDPASSASPTSFEFILEIDGIKYIYGFSATVDQIIDEYLYVFRSAKRSMIFDRSNTYNFRFNKADEKEFNDYKERNTRNKLFLATATAWNCEKTKPVYLWFAEKVETYTDNLTSFIAGPFNAFFDDKTEELHNFTLNLLKNADINISDYHVESQKTKINLPIGNNPKDPYENISYDIRYTHSLPDDRKYELGYYMESLGTQNLFCMSPLLFNALKYGQTLFLDELSCLHTALVRYLISIFNDPDINTNDAQLIFVTHDTNLLDLEMLRRDQIYFVEKDDYGVSDFYSLDDFSVRKTENIRNAYLIGRYGAYPAIKGGDLL